MQQLYTLDALTFMMIALVAMVGHGIKKWSMGEIRGNVIDWYVMRPRATVRALFACVVGVVGAILGGSLISPADGSQVVMCALIGYGADTLNSQTKGNGKCAPH